MLYPFKKAPRFIAVKPEPSAQPDPKDGEIAALKAQLAAAQVQAAQDATRQTSTPTASFAIPPLNFSKATLDATAARKAYELKRAQEQQQAAAAKFAQIHSPLNQTRAKIAETRETLRKVREAGEFSYARVLQAELDALLVEHAKMTGYASAPTALDAPNLPRF